MAQIPSAIIFINNDINQGILDKLVSQLQIDGYITGSEFDARMIADPNYPKQIELNNLRILVMRDSLADITNREYADVVMFVKLGQASILGNKYGPPGQTYMIDRINIYEILRDKTGYPSPATYPYPNNLPQPIKDMLFDPYDPSHAHDANPDNIFNNPEYLNRK